LWIDRSGLIWIAALEAGLFRFDPRGQTFSQYTPQEGLPDPRIFAILEDRQGDLWLSTGAGVVRLDPMRGIFQNFDARDGLPGSPFLPGAAHRSEQGELFFGNEAGLVVFYPEQVRTNPHVPPVVITDFQLFYEPVAPAARSGVSSPWRQTPQGDEILLSYTQNVFTLEYAALDFSDPAENQYAYRLEGFDQDWVFAGNRRQASYTNLPPGDYIFHVKGSNNDGVWNEAEASLRVVIQPPFWLTDWFRILAIGLAVGLLAGVVGLPLHGRQPEAPASARVRRTAS
jgi:hypothetical protein